MSAFNSIKRIVTTSASLGLAAASLVACGSDSSGYAAASGDTETITFAAVPAESSTTIQATFDNIIKLIEQEAGVDVEFQSATDYAAVIEGQRAGQIDIASYGPFSYVIAKESGVEIEAIASPTNDEEEAPSYTSVAYVRSDSDITSMDDIKGKTVCFVEAASTSGFLVPSKGILDAGLEVDKDITQVMAGGHDASLLSLDAGNCEVAFSHNSMIKTLENSGQLESGAIKQIWESEPIIEDPLAVNTSTLSPELVEKITSAIQEKANKPALVEAGICSSLDDCVLPEEIEWGYKPISDKDFDSIREICEVTNAEACHSVV